MSGNLGRTADVLRAVSLKSLAKRLGPGVITGAADDDPSGIATYSQAGAQFGFGLLWTVVLTWPMMVAVQSISARIGRVTGRGLAANMLDVFPRPVVGGAGRAAVRRQHDQYRRRPVGDGRGGQAGGRRQPASLHRRCSRSAALLGTVFIPYHRYVDVLKWLTFSLFAYVGIVFTVQIDWRAVAAGALLPQLRAVAATRSR